MYNCIIFDVDGTLINTSPAVTSSYQKVFFEEFGKHLDFQDMPQIYSTPTLQFLEILGFKNIDETAKKYHEFLIQEFSNVKAFSGILRVLDFIKNNNIATGLVTARNKKEVDDDPCLKELEKYFEFIICADDTEKHKPEAEPLLKLISTLNADPANTLYIGDTFDDYMCSKNAGVHFGLALWGAKFIEGIEAHYNLKSPDEILSLISR